MRGNLPAHPSVTIRKACLPREPKETSRKLWAVCPALPWTLTLPEQKLGSRSSRTAGQRMRTDSVPAGDAPGI